MYYIHTIKDSVNVSPIYFGEKIDEGVEKILRSRYERTLDKDLGIILAVFNVRDISDGRIIPGDPSTHHEVTFDVLAFQLEVEEVVVGEVSELADFGCFIRIGPVDGLVHMSQITSDFISYDRKAALFISRNTGRNLKKGDVVFGKVSSISLKNSIGDVKIALTMRPDGLGKYEWIKEPKKERKTTGRQGGRDSRGGRRPPRR